MVPCKWWPPRIAVRLSTSSLVNGSGQDSESRVQGAGFRFHGSGFRVQGWVPKEGGVVLAQVKVDGPRHLDHEVKLWAEQQFPVVEGFGLRDQGSGFRVQGTGFRVRGLGFRVWVLELVIGDQWPGFKEKQQFPVVEG